MRIGSSSVAFLALVISFSAIGRRALALASVVTMASAANSDAARLAIISFWCCELRPKLRALRGVAGMVVVSSAAQRQAALVELLLDLVKRLLPEVGDVQQVVLGLGEELADRVDLGPLEAVARTLRQVEVLDGEVEIGRRRAGRGDLTELEPLGFVAQAGDQIDQRTQGGTGRRQRLARSD